MILVFALLGIATAWLLHPISEYLIRIGSPEVKRAPFRWRAPMLVHLFRQQREIANFQIELGIELVSAGVFMLLYAIHGITALSLWLMVIYAFFALIALMDFRHRIVLNILTYSGLVIALVVNVLLLQQSLASILIGGIFGFVIFYGAATLRPGDIGGGDIKLAAMIGAALGFPLVLWALIIAAAVSAATIVFLLFIRHYTLKDSIPYAPFLCLGAVVVFIYSSITILP